MNITEIREAYPNAVRPHGAPSGSYCVGGALCQYKGILRNWPLESELRNLLMSENPNLGMKKAWEYACRITVQNDKGNIDGAWVWLQAALSYRPAAPPHPNYSQLARGEI